MCDCCDYIAARGGLPGDPALARQFELLERFRLRETISAGRWQNVTVEPDDQHPMVAYTVGLWSHGHPELVLFGLSRGEGDELLNTLGELVVTGLRIDDGDDLDLGEWQLKAFRIANPDQVIVRANAVYRQREPVPAMQLVYPDVHGVWPWEPGCHLWPNDQPMPGTFAAGTRSA